MRSEFIKTIKTSQSAFGLDLDDKTTERLADHYELVLEHNPLLHLVGPCSAEEFAVRHVLESLTMLEYLPQSARFADVGAGAGLPSIPCLIARNDLKAVLIESKEKKAAFLTEAVERLGLAGRVRVEAKQFSETGDMNFEFAACRAIDKFPAILPRLLKWTGKRKFLFFGGPALEETLRKAGASFERRLMPRSDQRYLFVGASGRN